jgi:PAS domain-containing protein
VPKELLAVSPQLIAENREPVAAGLPEPFSVPTGSWDCHLANPEAFVPDLLFAASVVPLLIVECARGHIVAANPAAAFLLGPAPAALVGTSFLQIFDESSSEAVCRSLVRARDARGIDDALNVCALRRGRQLHVTLSAFTAERKTYLRVRLAPDTVGHRAAGQGGATVVLQAVDAAPVGFLVANGAFQMEYANRAFLDMIGLHAHSKTQGEPLTRWLKLSPVDLERLRDQMFQRRAVSLLRARVEPRKGLSRRVEVCAVAVPDGEHTCWGFTVRELPSLN